MTPGGQILAGEPAGRPAVVNPEGTAPAFNRKTGKREKIRVRERECSPEQVSPFFLQKIKRDSESFPGETVGREAVTDSAYFDGNQRSATKDAGRIAGLEVLRPVNNRLRPPLHRDSNASIRNYGLSGSISAEAPRM